ncbi:MAG: peptidoglycan-binding domain-containing protein [Candidatus Paceibacterota bacterium]|jgi:peptidoglycan hydrolase-like protein with peptidoglycan-binding domain
MKKVLIASGVAVLAFAMIAGAQGMVFSTNLTVGSTGPDVVALQNTLMAAGYSIPAITSGAATPGYFGSQTQTAVKLYQAAKGIPNTGFVGPLTRGALNAGGVAASPVNCPVGFTCTSNAVTVNCPAGFTCTPIGGGAPIGTSLGNTDGSVSVSQSAYVSTGASLKKGETKNVVAVKLQATAGPVSVTRVDAHFSVRPWLFFSQAQLIDSTGKVLATKTLSNSTDVTEITVGSDYLVRFDGLNYVVTPGTNPDLAVNVSVLGATDKITNGMSVTANIPTGAIRTVNGLGFTDSIGGVTAGSTSGVGAATFTLSSTGSVADISTGISSLSPATQTTVPVSATVSTNDVTLGIFKIKSANNSSTINSMNMQTNTNVSATAQTGIFSNVRLMVGSQTYGALSYSAAGLATFTNLSIALSQDVWTDIKLVADVTATSTDVLASSTLVATSINAIDSTYTAATVGGLAMASATNSQTSVNTLLTVNSVSLSNPSAVIVQEIASVTNGPTNAATVAYTFTLTNNSSNSLYVSSNVSTLINGTSTVPASNASSTITAIEPIAAVPGDGTGYYILPSGGGSRTFTVTGIIQKASPTLRSERLSITSIQYGATTAGTNSNITSGLTTLTAAITI